MRSERSLIHVSTSYNSVVSYNQPRFSRYASWNENATTILTSTQLSYGPTRIIITTSDKWYVTRDGYGSIFSGVGNSTSLTSGAKGGFCIFVTADEDVYSYDQVNNQVTRGSINMSTSLPVMLVDNYCRGLFIDTNNTLYCCISDMSQVVKKSLDDPTNALKLVAGTDCHGIASNQLAFPAGIFVDIHFSLFVADTGNHRVQRFSYGQKNGTTVVGQDAPGTINLLSPKDIALDGNGYLFIVDTGNHRIIGSGPDGFRCVLGCTNTTGLASNQLSSPQSMSFDRDGHIWVADYGNLRVQKFIIKNNYSGEYP